MSFLNRQLQKLRASSLRPYFLTMGCCAIEVKSLLSSVYDLKRMGIEPVECPSEADVLVVSGWLNSSFQEKIKNSYRQLQPPQFVVAAGVCPISGSAYKKSNEKIEKNLQDLIPVDVFVSGCPPTAENFFEALLLLQEKVSPNPKQREILKSAIKSETIQV